MTMNIEEARKIIDSLNAARDEAPRPVNARLVEALKLARPHVENDSQRFYDGMMGALARGAAAGTLKMIDAALAEAEVQAVPRAETAERLKFELRQAMLDYGAAERAKDPDRIHETSERGTRLIDYLVALIAAPEAPAPAVEKPTGWVHRVRRPGKDGKQFVRGFTSTEPSVDALQIAEIDGEEYVPLYTHPRAQREPLTEDEIDRLLDVIGTCELIGDNVLEFARAIERAHGIGGT